MPFAFLLVAPVATVATAHSGGLDKQGCHTNRSTGERHCHARRSEPAPRRVSRGADADAYYASCAAARAAGAAPMRRGDPGYRPGLDRDEDGVACEVR